MDDLIKANESLPGEMDRAYISLSHFLCGNDNHENDFYFSQIGEAMETSICHWLLPCDCNSLSHGVDFIHRESHPRLQHKLWSIQYRNLSKTVVGSELASGPSYS